MELAEEHGFFDQFAPPQPAFTGKAVPQDRTNGMKNSHKNREARRSQPLAVLVDHWLADLAVDRAARTILRYRTILNQCLAWGAALEDHPLALADLHPLFFVQYRTALQVNHQPSTVNTHIAALRTFGHWLADHAYLAHDPTRRLKRVEHTVSTRPHALTPTQINAFVRATSRTRDPQRAMALVQLLLQTGMRIGECAMLHWHDISLSEKRGSVHIRTGKGNTSRTIPLNGSARQALADFVAPRFGIVPRLRAVAEHWSSIQASHTPLWLGQRGPLTVAGLERIIAGIVADGARRGSVPASTTPHTLRHTFATRYLASHPGDLVNLSRLLGHASVETTKLYLHPTATELAARVEAIDTNCYG